VPFAVGSSTQQGWPYSQQQHNPPEIRLQNMSEEELVSASSLSTHASLEPWSPEGHRYVGIPGAHDVLYGPATDEPYMSYPPSVSVMSIESPSPQPQGIHTPSSTRSPSFAQIPLPPSPRTSQGSIPYGPDQDTPRVPQTTFNSAYQPSQSYTLTGAGTLSQKVSASKRKRNDHGRREPTHSPSVSGDYVMVPSFSKTATNAKRMDTKTSRISAVPSPVFYHEQYPPPDEKRPRKSNEFILRKTSMGRKSGGRSLGMHLAPEKAAKAKELRGDGACWICCLQRDSVSHP
jgi:hypothetical protein